MPLLLARSAVTCTCLILLLVSASMYAIAYNSKLKSQGNVFHVSVPMRGISRLRGQPFATAVKTPCSVSTTCAAPSFVCSRKLFAE